MMATRRDYSPEASEASTDPAIPAIPVPPVAWSDEPDEPEHHEPPAPTPADERIKLGIATGSFVAMTVALVLGKDMIAAAFGGIVTTVVGHYFSNRRTP